MKPELEEYLKNWLFRANEDISVIQSLAENNIELYTSTICFHCQQAVEKYLKGFLVYNNTDFPKTHDLDFLLSKCISIDNKSFTNIGLKNLSEFGVDIRYPDDFYIPAISETREYTGLSHLKFRSHD